jgi:subtilisin-like proprotein convertase family protein
VGLLAGIGILTLTTSALGQYTALQGPVTINDNAPATPYPTVIDLTKVGIVGSLQKVTLSLQNLKHGYANDVGVLLVAPGGQTAVLMNNAGGGLPVNGVNLTFDTTGAVLPQFGAITSGTFAPADYSGASFDPPAPPGPYGTLDAMTNSVAAGKWTLYIQDSQVMSSGSIDSWSINLFTAPIITLATNAVTLSENGSAATVGFSLQDSSPPAQGFAITGIGAATNLVSLSSSMNGLNGVLTLTPKHNAYGTATLTVVIDDGLTKVTSDISVTVGFINQPPTIALTNQPPTILQGGISPSINLLLADVDNNPSDLKVTVSSSDTNVILTSGVSFSSTDTGAVRKFTIVPRGAVTGSAQLTFTVSDTNSATASATLNVSVIADKHAVKANANLLSGSASGVTNSSIVVSNMAGSIALATVTVNGLSGVSPNTLGLALQAPGGQVSLLKPSGGAGPNNFAQIVFADGGGQFPTTDTYTGSTVAPVQPLSSLINTSPNGTWTLWATNGGAPSQITGGWVLDVYIAPIVTSTITSISMPEQAETNITFTATSPNGAITNASDVTVTAGDPTLIQVSGVTFDPATGIGSAHLKALFSPTGTQYGTNTVSVTVKDNNTFTSTLSYNVAVTFVNHNPTISFIPKQTTYAGAVVGPVPCTIGDVDLPAQPLSVSATSDNQQLLPDNNIVLGGSGNNRTITLFPIGAASSMANVSLRVTDGNGGVATGTFILFVQGPGNPTFANLNSISVPANALAAPSTNLVSGIVGTISEVQVSVYDITHTVANNVNLLLVSPQGKTVLLMQHAGGSSAFNGTTVVFADSATSSLTSSQINSGIYKPTQLGSPVTFPSPAPQPPYASALSAFKGLNGTNANGAWVLYTYGDALGKGAIVNGWQLSIRTTPLVQQIADQTLPQNSGTSTVQVNVGDDQPGIDINVGAVSANPNVVQVAFELGTGGTRALDITPVPYQYGSNITVTVSAQVGTDVTTASTTTFHVTVYQVNLAPVVSAINDVTTSRAKAVTTTFTAWDPQGATLTPTAKSSDPKLIANSDIHISSGTVVGVTNGQSVYQYNISVLPSATLTGTATITVTVNDSLSQSASASFKANVTQGPPLFVNADGPIQIPTGYPLASNSVPYPSICTVSNLDGYVTGVKVTLVGFQHDYPQDVDALLVAPDNSTAVILMAHAGGGTPVAGVRLSFDQDATVAIPQTSALTDGTYVPACYAANLQFAPSAPVSGYSTNLNAFVGTSPNGNWQLYVKDDSVGALGSLTGWQLALETGPAIQPIAAQSTHENVPLALDVNLLSDTIDPTNLTVYAYSSGDAPTNLSWSLVQSITVTNKSAAVRGMTIIPTPNLPSTVTNVDGTVTINLIVTDGAVTNTSSFPLTVLYANQAPTVTTPTNNILFSEGSTATIPFNVKDVDSALYTSNIVVTSTDPNLVPNSPSNIVVTSSTNRFLPGQTGIVNVRVIPATPYTSGTNTLTFTITDGVSTPGNTVTLSIGHVYQAPIISGLPASQTIPAARLSAPISFTVSSPEGIAAKNLNVRAKSSDQTLVPDSNILLGGSADVRTIQFKPLGAASGTATISLTIDDTKATNSTYSMSLVVSSPPAGFFGSGQVVTIKTNGGAGQPYPIALNVNNMVGSIDHVLVELRGLSHTSPGNLDVLLVSPDGIPVMLMSGAGGTTAISGLDLVFDDDGAPMPPSGPLSSGTNHPGYYTLGKRLLPTPAPQTGYQGQLAAFQACTQVNGTWQLYVSDLTAGDSGQITDGAFLTMVTKPVIQVATAPPYNIPENGSLQVHFSVSDSLTATTNLGVAASSDNKGLLPASPPSVVISADAPGTNNNFTATLTPLLYQYGGVNLTITATRSDGVSSSTVLPISVVGTNFPPIVYRVLNQTNPATQPLSVSILVSDPDTALSDLYVSAVSLNPSVIANSNLVFANSTNHSNTQYGLAPIDVQLGQAVLNITPNQYTYGTAPIQITVTDPKKNLWTNTVTTSFQVTATKVIYDPTISSIAPQSLTAGTRSAPISFTVNTVNDGPPNLAVAGTSSDQTLVKNANIVVTPATGASSGARTVVISAEPKVKGTTTIRLTVTDTVNNRSAYTEFPLTVVPTPEHNYVISKAIVINDHAPATPYPSTLDVLDLDGTIKKVTVTLNGFTHTYPADVGVLLVAPSGQTIVLMNRAGGGVPVTNGITMTFDQSVSTVVPQGSALTNATYRPADWKVIQGAYDFPLPAPVHPYSTNLDSLVGASPTGTWSLYVVDDTASDAGNMTGGWSLSITTQPRIIGLTDVTVPENTTNSVPFAVADDSPSGPAFRFGVVSGDPTLIPTANVSASPTDATGTNFSLQIVPALNKFGTNSLTLYVTNIDNFVASSTIQVKVPFVLQPPIITLSTNQLWAPAGTVASLDFTYSDVQMSQDKLSVSFASDNPTLMPVSNIRLVNDVNGSHVVMRPMGAASGTAQITVTVAQPAGGLKSSASFALNVTPVQNLFGNGGAIVINDFSAATPYPSTTTVAGTYGKIVKTTVTVLGLTHTYPHDISMLLVGPQGQKVILMSQVAKAGGVTNIDLTFDSASPNVMPDNGQLTSGTWAPTSYNPNLVLYTNNVPGPYMTNLNAFKGTSPIGTWSLYVQDDAQQDSGIITAGWLLSFVTDAPMISSIGPQTTLENQPLAIGFDVSSAVVPNGSNLVVSAAASQESPPLLVSKGLLVSGPGTNAPTHRILTIVPGLNLPSAVTNTDGTAIITLTATDGTNTSYLSFPITVQYVNQAPTVVGLGNQVTPANAALTMPFSTSDPDTPAASLVLTANSSVTALGTLNLVTSGYNQTLTFTPNGTVGQTTVTVTVSDGTSIVTNNFTIDVVSAVPPFIAAIGPQTTKANVSINVPLTITDAAVPVSSLVLSGTAQPSLVSQITFNYAQGSWVATIQPALNAIGSGPITVTASDGIANASQIFTLTVTQPIAPAIGEIADQTATANAPLNVPLTITSPDTAISALTYKGSSTNSSLVSSISFAFNGTTEVATIHLVPNRSGNDLVTITVGDAWTTDSTSFSLEVTEPIGPTLGVQVAQGQLTVHLTGAANANYGILRTADLDTWSEIATVTTDSAGKAQYTAPTTGVAQFFRAIAK